MNNSLKQDFFSRNKVVCLLKKTTTKKHGKEIFIVEKSGLNLSFQEQTWDTLKFFCVVLDF